MKEIRESDLRVDDNVVVLHRFCGPEDRKIVSKTVAPADKAVLEQCADLDWAMDVAVDNLRRFVQSLNGREMLGVAMDGKYTAQRADELQDKIHDLAQALLGTVAGEGAALKFAAPIMRYVRSSSDIWLSPIDPDVRAVTVQRPERPVDVLSMRQMGFKDSILLAQEVLADAVISFARQLGIHTLPGDAGARLVSCIRTGRCSFNADPGAARRPVHLLDGDVVYFGFPR